MTNPKAGHTSASGMTNDSQGLRDGDGLTSPSLTNLYEGLHGNGILRLGDGAKGDSLRNSIIANTPGFIETTATQGELKVYGGYCVLDGVLYKFANGPGNHETFVLGTTGAGANHSGDLPSVPASNSDVFVVVYLVGRNTPEAHLMYEMGTPAAPSSGTPLIPNRFLSNPSITGNTDLNHQTTVLAVLRYTMTGGAGSVTSSLSTTPTINDRRAFIRQSPVYLTPMTKGSIGNVDAANIVTDPDGFFPSPEDGDFGGSTFGSIWMSHMEDVAGNKHAVIYAATPRNLNTTPATNTHILGPDRLEVQTTTGNITFEFNEGNVWIITTDTNRTINPVGNYPVGHTVEIHHSSGAHTLYFDSTVGGHSTTPINVNIPAGSFGKFIYDGADWKQLHLGSTTVVSTPSSGASGLVQLSDGSGGFTSDSDLSWDSASNELTINGKLTVTGLIDPTGLVIDEKANVAATGHTTVASKGLIWIKDDAPNNLYFTDDAGNDVPITNNGALDVATAGAITDGDFTTNGIMKRTGAGTYATAVADTDYQDVLAEGAFVDGDKTKLDGIATGATAYADADAIAAVEGESTLTLSSGVTVGTDLKMTTSSDNAIIENVTQDKDIIFQVNDGGSANTEVMRIDGSESRVGIGTDSPLGTLHVKNSNTDYAALFESDDDGASAAPDVALYRNGLTPANGDDLGHLIWRGTTDDGDSTVTRTNITDIFSELQVAATGTESGKMHLRTKKAGTMNKRISIEATKTVVNEDGVDVDFVIESDNNANMFFVDAGNDRVGIGTNSPDAPLHVETSGAGDAVIIESTDAGATEAPDLVLYRNSASPAASDEIGSIRFRGKDNAAGDKDYNRITSVIRDTTATSADADLIFQSLSNSIEIEMMKISRIDGIVINEIGANYIDTRIESDSEANMFFVDASANAIGIANASPSATLDMKTGGTFRNTRLLTVSVSASTTLTEAAHAGRYNICAGNITLPATSTAGEHYAILNTTGGDITIGRNGNNINGAASDFTLGTYNAATCIAIGSNNWMVVG
jgi:hypothetical protein